MTDPENREADAEETEDVLRAEASAQEPSEEPSPDSEEQPVPEAAQAAEPPAETAPETAPEALPEREHQEERQEEDLEASAGEPGAEPASAPEAGEAGSEAGPAPAPPQPIATRIAALEQLIASAVDRSRLVSRVQALRKRLEEAVDEERAALAERLDRLDAACQEHLAENLRRKEELAAQAEALAESTEWKSTAEAIKAMQAAWKTIGPVAQEVSQDLWQRFRKAGNTFFERYHEHRKESSKNVEENLARKEELCAKAEELSQSSDWKETAEAIKALQTEWRTIGPVAREQADEVWKRFRKAADAFFDRRKEHSDELRKLQDENLRLKEALVARAEELSQSTQWKATVQAIKELQAEWRTTGPAPSHKAEGVWRRFRGAIDVFFERQSAYFAQRGSQDAAKRQDQMLDALERKREQANRVRESIERDEATLGRWRAQLAEVEPGEGGDEARAGLDGKIADVEGKLPAKRQRLAELETTIQEIAAKLN
jgi:Domain of Unknown Function (DUF349)